MTHFDRCRGRLQTAIEGACEGQTSWPARVAAAVLATLDLAARDPDLCRTLTEGAGHRRGEDEEFTAMIDHLAAQLGRGAPTRSRRLPDAPKVIALIARQVNLELEAGRGRTLPEVAPDLTFLALLPYLGFAEARRWSQPTATA